MDITVPAPEEIKELPLRHDKEIGVFVGDQIVHSAKTGQYYAFRADMIEALGKATEKSVNREWLPMASIPELEPNVTLVYKDNKLEDIALIADTEEICRPDLIIECIGQDKLYNTDSLKRISEYHGSLKPKLGTYLVFNQQMTTKAPDEQLEGIHFLQVGFDQSKLEQVVNLFVVKEESDK
jgi:hypothetical protein